VKLVTGKTKQTKKWLRQFTGEIFMIFTIFEYRFLTAHKDSSNRDYKGWSNENPVISFSKFSIHMYICMYKVRTKPPSPET